jgi:hypothetical protein
MPPTTAATANQSLLYVDSRMSAVRISAHHASLQTTRSSKEVLC